MKNKVVAIRVVPEPDIYANCRVYTVTPRFLSQSVMGYLSGHLSFSGPSGVPLRFEQLVFTCQGKTISPSKSVIIEIHSLDFSNVDFKGADIQYIEFEGCQFSSDKIGGAKLTKTQLRRCRVGNYEDIQEENLIRIFQSSFEVLPPLNDKFGEVFLVDEKRVICGCRYFTIDQAIKHWSKGSQSGGGKFARDLVDYLFDIPN